MDKRAPYARIAITLPPEDLEAADRLASEWDRSRSWVVAEAVRRLVASQPTGQAPEVSTLGESRLRQLRRDLMLTPEQRVLVADETLRNSASHDASPAGARFFDRYEDFLDWKTRRGRAP